MTSLSTDSVQIQNSIVSHTKDESQLDAIVEEINTDEPTERSISNTEDDDTKYDTDLEIEDEKTEYHDISYQKIYMEACRELNVVPASYFMRHMKDEVLVMRHHGLGPLGAKALAIPLISNTSVLHLDLEDNWIESSGAIYLCEMLKENCYITHLNLSNNRLAHEGAVAICDMLQNNMSLTALHLSGNGLQDKVAPLFAAALLENNRLRDLNLSHNEFGQVAGDLIGHAIGENEVLESFDMSWNRISGKAGTNMMEGIRSSSRLKYANMAWNGIGNVGALTIAECLRSNHLLVELDVSCNRLTAEGVEVIAKGLDANEWLKKLKIGMNTMGSYGAELLLKAINNDRSILEELDLTQVHVEKSFAKLVEEMCEHRQLVVKHGGILSNYVLKEPPPIKKPSTEVQEGEQQAEVTPADT